MKQHEIAIEKITIGVRHRCDLGEMTPLVESIRTLGLLQPVVLDSRHCLIAGQRRLAACQALGQKTIPYVVAEDIDDALRLLQAERDENTCRKDFNTSEAIAMGKAIEDLERPKAAERKKATQAKPGNQKAKKNGERNLRSPLATSTGKTSVKAAEAVGMKPRNYEKAKKVAAAAESNPKAYGDLVEQMDKSGNVHQAFTELKRREKRKDLAKKARAAKKRMPKHAWRIINDDCLNALRNEVDAGTVRLIFADPPYNIGVDYGRGANADRLEARDYLAWCRDWMELCASRLTADGSLWVMINDEWADHFGVMLTEIGLHRRSWIKWYEAFGVNCANNFNRCSRHIFYCVKDPGAFVFNPDPVTRASDRQIKYGDKRANPGGKIWDDVWQVPRVSGTSAERIPDFPTQVPLAITRAIVGCASEPGDIVLDPFSGSASTGCAAVEAGRQYIGIEWEERFCEWSHERLLVLMGEREHAQAS